MKKMLKLFLCLVLIATSLSFPSHKRDNESIQSESESESDSSNSDSAIVEEKEASDMAIMIKSSSLKFVESLNKTGPNYLAQIQNYMTSQGFNGTNLSDVSNYLASSTETQIATMIGILQIEWDLQDVLGEISRDMTEKRTKTVTQLPHKS